MSSRIAVVVGRWQLVHRGHAELLRAALADHDKVIVVIGSAWRSRDVRNPFTWEERAEQIGAALAAPDRARVTCVPIRDRHDDRAWDAAVRAGIARVARSGDALELVGCRGDATSAYGGRFGASTVIEVERQVDVEATELRRRYFEAPKAPAAALGEHVEPGVRDLLETWARTAAYRRCAAEHAAVVAYRAKYTQPFALTADAVVTARGRVLLVRRGGEIGHGLLALPGGFLDPSERFHTAAVRELEEETGLGLPRQLLDSALRGEAVFDRPQRSPRARIVTMAFHIDLGGEPPPVRGADDAQDAEWAEVAGLLAREQELFEDHASILDHFLRIFPADDVAFARR